MSAWIFQANPSKFDLDGYLAVQKEPPWLANQHRDEIRVGDPVFVWRTGEHAGVVAQAVVIEPASLRPVDEAALPFWSDQTQGKAPEYRVRLRIHRVANKKQVVRRQWLVGDPICADLPNIRFSQGTNFPLEPRHFERLAALCERTGTDFDENDLEVSLLAYAETFGGPVSEKPDSPVAGAAVQIGRAVSSVYAKVMNFRALDPRHQGAGQSHGNSDDLIIWNRYWTGTDIDIERLRAAVQNSGDSLPKTEESTRADYRGSEGERRLVRHLQIERNRSLIKKAKAVWIARDPQLRCEVCYESFSEKYPGLGDGFIEAHHQHTLAEAEGPVETTIDDLAPVCANCHRMLHRNGLRDINELRRIVGKSAT